MATESLDPDDPEWGRKITERVLGLEREVAKLKRRPGPDPSAVAWAMRKDVAKRFLPEVERRARAEAGGFHDEILPAVPLLQDAKNALGSWAGLEAKMREVNGDA